MIEPSRLLPALLVAVVGCGSGDDDSGEARAESNVDTEQRAFTRTIESYIGEGLHERYGQKVSHVTCPTSQVGTFECEAWLGSDNMLPVEVTVRPDRSFEAVEKPVILLDKLQSVIAERYRLRGRDVQPTCGGVVRVSQPGSRFECTAGGEVVVVTVTSWQGRVELAYPGEASSPGASTAASRSGDTTP